MVTYLYWGFIAAIVLGVLYLMGYRLKQWTPAIVIGGIVMIFSSFFYYFYLEQIFVKRWGGTMSISIPDGQRHIAATWKEDNLWIENFDSKSNTCIFQEYSRGNMLEGRVVIKNCNPLSLSAQPLAPSPALGTP